MKGGSGPEAAGVEALACWPRNGGSRLALTSALTSSDATTLPDRDTTSSFMSRGWAAGGATWLLDHLALATAASCAAGLNQLAACCRAGCILLPVHGKVTVVSPLWSCVGLKKTLAAALPLSPSDRNLSPRCSRRCAAAWPTPHARCAAFALARGEPSLCEPWPRSSPWTRAPLTACGKTSCRPRRSGGATGGGGGGSLAGAPRILTAMATQALRQRRRASPEPSSPAPSDAGSDSCSVPCSMFCPFCPYARGA